MRYPSQEWLEAYTSEILILFYEMYCSRCPEHDVVVFICLPLQEALNHWFNKQDSSGAGAAFQVEAEKEVWDWSEESGSGEEHVEFSGGGGLLISSVKAVGKQHGNQLVVGFLSVLQLWASPFISSSLTDLAGQPEVKVTQGRRLQTRHRTCVSLCPPGLHP